MVCLISYTHGVDLLYQRISPKWRFSWPGLERPSSLGSPSLLMVSINLPRGLAYADYQ